jgi:hypothetical protein
MDCPAVTTYEEAVRNLPISVLPVQGLRRDDNGMLSEDALRTILDGLRSRGMDVGDEEQRKAIIKEMAGLLCTVYSQYQFLMKDFRERLVAGDTITVPYLTPIRERNQILLDLLTISRRISEQKLNVEPFVEGFQAAPPPAGASQPLTESLQKDRILLYLESASQMRQHTITITQEKNKTAANMLGMFGFLNIVAVGLLIYLYRA